MVATAVFQTAIITLGAKSQKVQARSKRMLSFLHPMSCVLLQVPNPLADGLFPSQPGTKSCIVLQVCLQGVETQLAETSEGLQWTFLFLLPFASFIYPTIYIYILLIRQDTKLGMSTCQSYTIFTSGTMTKDPSHRAILLRQRSSKLLIVDSIYGIIDTHQGIRQRNRTNLLTAKQSLNLLLITVI